MKSLKLLTFHLLCLSVSLTYLSGITQAKNGVKTTLSQTQLSQGDHVIHFADNRLTVNVKNYSLASLLPEIARQSGLTLKCSVPTDERITLEIHFGLRGQFLYHGLMGFSKNLLMRAKKWLKRGATLSIWLISHL